MTNIKFEILKNADINHLGKIIFHNNKELKTPIAWFGLSVIEPEKFQIKVFKESKVEAFLSNAYDLYYRDTKNVRASLINKLKKLNLAHKMDSGGFQYMKKKASGKSQKFDLTPKMVLEKQLEFESDCCVQLDFPFSPKLNKAQKFKRLNKTLANLEKTIELIDNFNEKVSFLPVIHTVANDLELLEYGLDKMENILGYEPRVIGVGSLVPLVKSMKGSKKNGIESLLYTLICLRKKLPNAFIHAFGLGGTMAYLAVLAGVDSYDSNGWIQKAAYGVIQLPGISDRFLRKESHNRPYLIKDRNQRNSKKPINEIDIFMKCKCSACSRFYSDNWKKKDWKKKQKAFIGRDQEPKMLRAIHNLSLYQNEIFEMREAIKKNFLKAFIKERLRFSIYYKYIKFIERLKSLSLEELYSFKDVLNMNTKFKKLTKF